MNETLKNLSTITIRTQIFILTAICFLFAWNHILQMNSLEDPRYDDYYHFDYAYEVHQYGLQHYLLELPRITLADLLYKSLIRDPIEEFFVRARYLNLFMGLLMILCVFFVGKRLFGTHIALITAFLISSNFIVLEQSTLVSAENLLLLFGIVAIYFLVRGFRNPSYSILGLFFAGLAFLSKANGSILFVAFFLSIFILLFLKWKETSWRKQKKFYLVLLLVMGLISVWKFSFLYSIVQTQTEHFLLKENPIDITEYPTYGYYNSLDEVGFQELIKRVIWGTTRQLHRYSVALFASVEWNYKDFFSLNLGWIIVPLAFFLISREKQIERKVFFLTLAWVSLISAIPRSIGNHSAARYTILMAPVFYFYLSPYLYFLASWLKKRYKIQLHYSIISAFLFVFFFNGIQFRKNLNNFSFYPRLSQEYKQSLEWLKQNTERGDGIVFERNSTLAGYKWYVGSDKIKEENIGSTRNKMDISAQNLLEDFKRRSLRFVIIDLESRSPYNKETKRYFFRKEITRTQDGVEIKNLPAELKLVYPEKELTESSRILIFEIQTQVPYRIEF